MGWELHITRADDWSASATTPIDESEWLSIATTHANLQRVSPDVFCWRDQSGPSMYWSDGEVIVKGVRSEREIGEIAAFANGLDASLQGDDGETYNEAGQPSG